MFFSAKIIQYTCILNLLPLFFVVNLSTAGSSPSYSFWYGINPPVDLLSQFDRIVVEADNLNNQEIKALQQHSGKVLAYLSIGENSTRSPATGTINSTWVLGTNPHWKSQILDLSAPGWQEFILQRANQLADRGIQGFFLDTLDSYNLVKLSQSEKENQQQSLIQLIQTIKKRFPDLSLVANRGFEVMDQIAPYLEAVAAESLYQGWNNSKQKYLPVSEQDRVWLTTTLKEIRSKYNIDIVVLDYLPPDRRELAREVAKKIEQDNFIPWVANPSFDYMGIGLLEVIPRKILMLYDSASEDEPTSIIHRLADLPLQYLGYLPVYIDIRHQELPQGILKGRYSGVVSWMNTQINHFSYQSWLVERIRETTPIAILNDTTVLLQAPLAKATGLKRVSPLDLGSLKTIAQSELIGFETDELGRIDEVPPLLIKKEKNNSTHLRMEDKYQHQVDLVVTGDWGGYVSSPALLDSDFNYDTLWVLNPFAFFEKALQLPQIPAPEVTTENGRRLFFIHVDGDGFMEKFEIPNKGYAPEILLQNIFKQYHIPHTISIIEGEVGPTGLYPELSSHLETIARKIFRLNHVEIASHSYSHPFQWGNAPSDTQSKGYHLPIERYRFSLDREILGSVKYINTTLAPKNKQTKVFLWTGNCLPTIQAIEMAESAGLLSMNGGNTIISTIHPSLTYVAALTRHVGKKIQVFAPIQNENVFTNNWIGPFYGYRRVIETFKMTDIPRRLKPINIYYHFYSGSKQASLKALQKVYDWALTQETMPIYASDYINKVLNYYTIGVARKNDGTWRITGLNYLRTIRINKQDGWPQDKTIQGLAGWRELQDGLYLHAGTASTVEFKLGGKKPESLHLYQSNGRLIKWQKHSKGIDFRIQGNVPVMMELENAKKECKVVSQKGVLSPKKTKDGRVMFSFPTKDTGNVRLKCYE